MAATRFKYALRITLTRGYRAPVAGKRAILSATEVVRGE